MKQLQEQRIREIVQEELGKREATSVTLTPKITISLDASIEKIIEKILAEFEEAKEEAERNCT
ncbi:hypothetical protein B7C51_03435 [Paenibacillus larvae subsp. pulvifaciens]|uniref:Uncharacterized protein n=1 Tax=Paenibacillus larvae subsp. pulvifaciens TaxID=1477 RepID=A0A1V0UPL3_9BACL|nr:hypothetical protein [Paenibacillus larvae]ARF67067.1 hypothetical protein B7C51_03435 [Paenibacillus larvae subsp. pulvifaciens]